jgi:transposase-like protein
MPRSRKQPTEPPPGYDEIGETLASAVLEGSQSQNWAASIARLLGYNRDTLRAWLAWYEHLHGKRIARIERKMARHQAKIDRLKAAVQDLEDRQMTRRNRSSKQADG